MTLSTLFNTAEPDQDAILRYLETSMSVDQINQPLDEKGRTALHIAAEKGLLSVIQKLVEGGADIDQLDKSGNTALMYAAASGHEDTALGILNLNADISIKNNDQIDNPLVKYDILSACETALHLAARKGLATLIKTLLQMGANANAQNRRRDTPLMVALTCQKEAVALTLAEKANVSLVNRNGESSLHSAAARGYTTIVEILMCKGADAALPKTLYIDSKGSLSSTFCSSALMQAVSSEHEETALAMLRLQPEACQKRMHGYRVLELAVARNLRQLISTLDKMGIDINMKVGPLFMRQTLLDNALRKEHLTTTTNLITLGAELTAQNLREILNSEKTPLYFVLLSNEALYRLLSKSNIASVDLSDDSNSQQVASKMLRMRGAVQLANRYQVQCSQNQNGTTAWNKLMSTHVTTTWKNLMSRLDYYVWHKLLTNASRSARDTLMSDLKEYMPKTDGEIDVSKIYELNHQSFPLEPFLMHEFSAYLLQYHNRLGYIRHYMHASTCDATNYPEKYANVLSELMSHLYAADGLEGLDDIDADGLKSLEHVNKDINSTPFFNDITEKYQKIFDCALELLAMSTEGYYSPTAGPEIKRLQEHCRNGFLPLALISTLPQAHQIKTTKHQFNPWHIIVKECPDVIENPRFNYVCGEIETETLREALQQEDESGETPLQLAVTLDRNELMALFGTLIGEEELKKLLAEKDATNAANVLVDTPPAIIISAKEGVTEQLSAPGTSIHNVQTPKNVNVS